MASNDGWEDVPVDGHAAAGDGWEDVPVSAEERGSGGGNWKETVMAEPGKHFSGTDAFLLNMAHTYPFVDKAAAALKAAQLKLQGNPMDFGENYDQALNQIHRNAAQADKEHHVQGTTGKVAGYVAPAALMPSLNVGKALGAVGFGAKVLNGGANGAIQGGIQALSDDNSGDLIHKLQSAYDGAKTGAAMGMAAPYVGKAIGAAGGTLKEAGISQGRRFLTGIGNTLSNKLAMPREVVERALQEKLIPAFGSVQTAAERAAAHADEAGSQLGSLLEAAEKHGVKGPEAARLVQELEGMQASLNRSGNVDPNVKGRIASAIEQLKEQIPQHPASGGVAPAPAGMAPKITPPPGTPITAPRPVIKPGAPPAFGEPTPAPEGTVNLRRPTPPMGNPAPAPAPAEALPPTPVLQSPPVKRTPAKFGLLQTENMKRSQANLVDYDQPLESPANRMGKDIAGVYRNAVEKQIEDAAAASPQNAQLQNIAKDFVPLKQRVGDLIAARDAARLAANRMQKNAQVPLKAMVAGAGMGAPAGIAAWAAPKYLNSSAARGAYSLGQSLGKVGEALTKDPASLGAYGTVLQRAAERSPAALAATHFTLSQSDPHYQAIHQGEAPADTDTKE